MKVLVFAAHPDDEVLGMGGTLCVHAAEQGDEVRVVCVTDGEATIPLRPGSDPARDAVSEGQSLGRARIGLVVADTSDGLRLDGGLVALSTETIRPGRIQAVRMVEPLFWRAFGWCRLEVDVAGKQRRLVPLGDSGDEAVDLSAGRDRLLPVRPPSPSGGHRP